MRKTEIQYYYGQDGEIVDPYIKRIFSLGTQDMEYSEEKKADIYNVVGFVYYQEKILTIFPKHYFDVLQLEILNTEKKEIEDIKLLYKVIKKYSENEKTKAAARKYMGPDSAERYDSDYPFSSFYEVYDYYRKFGLYKERTESIKVNGNGRVSWKETIRKSQKIISNGNLIFSPLMTIKKNYQDVFLSECMAFVINYTLDCFHSFISLKPVKGTAYKFDYINNIDYVIAKLNESKEQLSLSGLMQLGSAGENVAADSGKDMESGLAYREYLRMLLFLKSQDEVGMRTLDMVEQNLKIRYGQTFFRADACISRVEFHSTCNLRRGIMYDFPTYFGYN